MRAWLRALATRESEARARRKRAQTLCTPLVVRLVHRMCVCEFARVYYDDGRVCFCI